MAESCYLRYPHLAGDLVTFAAEDGVWLASLFGLARAQDSQISPDSQGDNEKRLLGEPPLPRRYPIAMPLEVR